MRKSRGLSSNRTQTISDFDFNASNPDTNHMNPFESKISQLKSIEEERYLRDQQIKLAQSEVREAERIEEDN